MRVIAGKYKRLNLKTLEGDNTRPTRDMVREALFSSIDVEGANVLDLFSGSGAIGIEALSRGAEDAVFNDSNRSAYNVIKSNLAYLKEDRTVYNLDCFDCLESLKGRQFDFVYLDPPYVFDDFSKLFDLMTSLDLLSDDVRIVAEVRKDHDLPENLSGYSCYKEKKYGINKLLYYRKGINNA